VGARWSDELGYGGAFVGSKSLIYQPVGSAVRTACSSRTLAVIHSRGHVTRDGVHDARAIRGRAIHQRLRRGGRDGQAGWEGNESKRREELR
jgi:hypothetical protein